MELRLNLASDTLATFLQLSLAQISNGCVYTDVFKPNILVLNGVDIDEDLKKAVQILDQWKKFKFCSTKDDK